MPPAILPLVLAAVGALIPQAARACKCRVATPFSEKPPSSSISADTSVFLGTVESVYAVNEELANAHRSSGDPEQLLELWKGVVTPVEAVEIRKGGSDNRTISLFRHNSRRVRLRVDEVFVGLPGRAFELLSGAGGCCDCSFGFESGKQYLVIANRSESRWSTNICLGTTKASSGKLEIEALRAWKRGQRPYGRDGHRRRWKLRPAAPQIRAQ